MSLKRALLYLVVLVLAVGTIPAGIVAHGLLGRALEEQVRESLAMAPELLDTRWSATVDVRMMHARDVARTPGLAQALMDGDASRAARMVEQAGASFPEAPILVGSGGEPLIPAEPVPAELLEATRRGEMPVAVVPGRGSVRVVSLAPVEMEETWVGAAGGISVLDASEAATLAGLTRSEVLILDGDGAVVGASTGEEQAASLGLRGHRPRPGWPDRKGRTFDTSPSMGDPHRLGPVSGSFRAPGFGVRSGIPEGSGPGVGRDASSPADRPLERRDHPGSGHDSRDPLRRAVGPAGREPRRCGGPSGCRGFRSPPRTRRGIRGHPGF